MTRFERKFRYVQRLVHLVAKRRPKDIRTLSNEQLEGLSVSVTELDMACLELRSIVDRQIVHRQACDE